MLLVQELSSIEGHGHMLELVLTCVFCVILVSMIAPSYNADEQVSSLLLQVEKSRNKARGKMVNKV